MIRTVSRIIIGLVAGALVRTPVALVRTPVADAMMDYCDFPIEFRVALAVLAGAGFKLVDLASEHGAPARFVVFAALTTAFAVLHIVEPTWTVGEMVFHGVIRGKCDSKKGVVVAAIVLPLLLLVPRCAEIDVPLMLAYVFVGVVHNQLNKRLHWGDTLANQFRADKLALLALFPTWRTLEFLGVAYAEQFAYALVKMRAQQETWYRV